MLAYQAALVGVLLLPVAWLLGDILGRIQIWMRRRRRG